MEVDAGSAAGRSRYAGQVYYFCSSSCQAKFDADPAKFIEVGDVSAHQTVAPDKNSTKQELHLGAIYTCPMHPEIGNQPDLKTSCATSSRFASTRSCCSIARFSSVA
jgi:Cu+-exporting ATPase